MQVKKHKHNEYFITKDEVYVRNFTKPNVPFFDLNNMTTEQDHLLFLKNETENGRHKYPRIDGENIFLPNIVIVSNGFKFSEKQCLLAKLPKDIAIIGVNKSLRYWTLLRDNPLKRVINYYVVNNPYVDALGFVPNSHRYYPPCIASSRTNPEFIQSYKGDKYLYTATENARYSGPLRSENFSVDDYRNPVCAAIGLAYKFGVQKLLLFCCDDTFADERPGSIRLENGLYCYPQQLISRQLIDANLYWLKNSVKIGIHSALPNLEYASYITETEVLDFFNDEQEI